MTTTASPQAVRLSRPGWRDPRLLVGIVLVALSVALGAMAVSAAGRTVPVLAATRALVPGDPLASADSSSAGPARRGGGPVSRCRRGSEEQDLVVVRTVGAGELVPAAAVAPAAALDLRSVAVTPLGALSDGVVPGAAVDLWFVPAASAGQVAEPPRQLAAGLTVAEVTEPGGALSIGGVDQRARAGTARPAVRRARRGGRRRLGRGGAGRWGGAAAVTAVLCAVRGAREAAVVRALRRPRR